MVIVAEPVPLPLHAPLLVIATGSVELAVADTEKVLLYAALAGACVPTVILWLASCAAVVSCTWEAAL